MANWPDPVRPDLPVDLIGEAEINEALQLTVRFLDDPDDPAWTPELFGAICGCRAALVACLEPLTLGRLARGTQYSDAFVWDQLGREYTARKVARGVINELRQWLPEDRNPT